ncbi:Nif3-like dinuclear metal center hexameric protein [Cryomorphaceae bacterium 1068]|nr:Nif3-like dinuclear metal center hexameric protein [Cryomorphaceae bacterium 1068]
MPQIKDICIYLEQWAPPAYSESYDNVGLLVGDRDKEVNGILVSLDCTEAIIDEAIEKGCNLVVSHHPIVFKGLKSLTGKTYVERTILKAIKNGIALYAIHTNLDSVLTGVNGRIADRLELVNRTILNPKKGGLNKLTVFVPKEDAEKVRTALFKAGGGVIGNYSSCSFNVEGTGTFRPEDGAKPTIGAIGKTQMQEESRVEIMFPGYLSSKMLAAMSASHPYEEVAYYLHSLENENQYVGSGMIGELSEKMEASDFLSFLKDSMELKVVRHTKLLQMDIKRVAICGGSGSFLLGDAKRSGADVLITGDFKYHEFFDAEGELMIADIGHYESERFTIDLIADYLRENFTTFAVRLTEVNTNPIHYF